VVGKVLLGELFMVSNKLNDSMRYLGSTNTLR